MTSESGLITAEEMAREAGIDPKRFRSELRKRKFPWHGHYERWLVTKDSEHHVAMADVLATLRTIS